MKKAKLLIPLIAILVGTVTAWASQQQQGCALLPQYYYNGSSYIPAGVLGKDYMCVSGSSTCSYYVAGGTYYPCQAGVYTPLRAKALRK